MGAPIEQNRQFFRIVMLGLLAWGLFVALGAFLGPRFWERPKPANDETSVTTAAEKDAPARTLNAKFDYRKPIVVVTTVGIFLGIWALLLYSRQQRLEREEAAKQHD